MFFCIAEDDDDPYEPEDDDDEPYDPAMMDEPYDPTEVSVKTVAEPKPAPPAATIVSKEPAKPAPSTATAPAPSKPDLNLSAVNLGLVLNQISQSNNPAEMTAALLATVAAKGSLTDQQTLLQELTSRIEEQKKLLESRKEKTLEKTKTLEASIVDGSTVPSTTGTGIDSKLQTSDQTEKAPTLVSNIVSASTLGAVQPSVIASANAEVKNEVNTGATQSNLGFPGKVSMMQDTSTVEPVIDKNPVAEPLTKPMSHSIFTLRREKDKIKQLEVETPPIEAPEGLTMLPPALQSLLGGTIKSKEEEKNPTMESQPHDKDVITTAPTEMPDVGDDDNDEDNDLYLEELEKEETQLQEMYSQPHIPGLGFPSESLITSSYQEKTSSSFIPGLGGSPQKSPGNAMGWLAMGTAGNKQPMPQDSFIPGFISTSSSATETSNFSWIKTTQSSEPEQKDQVQAKEKEEPTKDGKQESQSKTAPKVDKDSSTTRRKSRSRSRDRRRRRSRSKDRRRSRSRERSK